MNNSGKNIDFELIARHLSGETSPEEEQALNAWLDTAPENRSVFEEYKTLWQKLGKVDSISDLDLDAEWEHLESRMEESDARPDSRVDRSRSLVFTAGRIAAAAVLVLILGFAGLYVSRNVGYRTLATENSYEDIALPEGSTVTLNKNSSLTYPRRFKKDQRVVNLEGEGFFEVTGDPDWPFVINTAEVEIRVLGTSFNVNAYKTNDKTEITVRTGEVAVICHGEVPRTVILKPGSRAVYNKSNDDLSLSRVIDKNYLAWKTRNFVFEDSKLLEVVASLNKVYGSEIIIPSDSIKEARITTTFNDQSIEAILNVLSATLDLEIVRNNGQILLKETN